MDSKARQRGHRTAGGLLLVLLAIFSFGQNVDSNKGGQPNVDPVARPTLTAIELRELMTKANSGDAKAELQLGQAYRHGNGVPKNEESAFKWIQKAAERGDADAENDLGTMYRLGEGVARDKGEAFRWYQKAARHGSAVGMFNLGTCHYNGDGVNSNEYTAYLWFILAQEAGDPIANDAVRRSEASMEKSDRADAYYNIAKMYHKGEDLPKDEARFLRWMRKSADLGSPGKVELALYLLSGPETSRDYPQALDLCKAAAKDYRPAISCVGYIYRKGLGVPQDSAEAAKWYKKAAAGSDAVALIVMAEMYSTGEGTKIDRPAAFISLVGAFSMHVDGAKEKANRLLHQLSKQELKETEKKLREMHLDPVKVFQLVQPVPPS